MEPRTVVNPRHPGGDSRAKDVGLHHRADDGVPDGSEGRVRRVKRVGNFHVFEAAITRDAAQRRVIDDLLSYFGGQSQLLMAHLIESGKISLADVREAEKILKNHRRKGD
jgi:hypothetical protein